MENLSIPKKIWNTLYPVLVHLAIYFAIVYVGIFIFAERYGITSVDALMSDNFAVIVCIALAISFAIELLFFKKDSVVNFHEDIRKPLNIILLVFLGALLAHGLSILVSLLNIDGILGSYEDASAELFGPSLIFVIIRAVLLGPVTEELIFRGLVFRRLKNYLRLSETGKFWVSAVVSSLLFGAYHMNLSQGVYAFLYGLALCYVYERFKNIIAPMIMHMAANGISVAIELCGAEYAYTWMYYAAMILSLVISGAVLVYFSKHTYPGGN